MLKRKQVVLMISIAVICLLVGTTFDVVVMAGPKEDLLRKVLIWLYTKVISLESKIESLQTEMKSLNASLIELQSSIAHLETTVADLEAKVEGTLVSSYRIQVFGHAKHDVFYTTNTSYVAVPDTLSSRAIMSSIPGPLPDTQRWYRVEVSFAVNHDQTIYLRMRDPWNNITSWEFNFTGGHAPNSWWSYSTTDRFSVGDPWNRQNQLEIKASDTSGAYLGSVWIIVEDIRN